MPRSLLPILVLLAIACGEPTRPVPTSEQALVISAATQSLQVPRTLQASASGGAGAMSWGSSDQAVAVVSASGLVTARFPGEAIITVRRGSQSATLALSVTATRLDVAPDSLSVAVNGTSQLTAIARDADGTALDGVRVSWSTANGGVATVDVAGVVTGIATGITTIYATGGGVGGGTTVTVGTPDNPFARIAFSSIRTVGNYACGLEAQTGLAYCWGDNHSGALGIGEVDGSDTPMLVSPARRFHSLSVGYYGNCAIEAETGFAYCWGGNNYGNLGDGTLTTRWVPTPVEGGVRFGSISASGERSCGVEAETGFGYCWGREGRLEDGTLQRRSVPTPVRTGGARIRFSSITVDGHACGVEVETGRAYCWGQNESGQLGDGTTIDRLAPTLVAGGRLRFTSISPGSAATCGVEAHTRSAFCWGSNEFGQLGNGTTTARLKPEIVAGSALRFAAVSSRGDMTCGIEAETGVAYCWGRGYAGAPRLTPTMVGDGDRIQFSSISVGGGACAVEAETGRGYCWGESLVPTPLAPGSAVVSSRMR